MAAKDAFLYFHNFNKRFFIYTDSSDCQLGTILSQDSRIIAYWSRKMTDAQQKYGTIGQELLTITKFLKQIRNMLLGMDITIYMDHKNLTLTDTQYKNDRIMRQRLYIK